MKDNAVGTSNSGQVDNVTMSQRLASIAAQYKRPLLGYFSKRINDKTEAEDLVQEVFVRLLQRNRDDPVLRVDQYLFQTAANVLTDRHRRRAARGLDQAQQLIETELPQSGANPEDAAISHESLAQFIGVLNSLPERSRDIFVLRVLEGYKLADIASRMNITERAVQKHMARSLKLLMAVFEVIK